MGDYYRKHAYELQLNDKFVIGDAIEKGTHYMVVEGSWKDDHDRWGLINTDSYDHSCWISKKSETLVWIESIDVDTIVGM